MRRPARTCPKYGSWFGYSHSTDGIHSQLEECSGRGTCNRATGECRCQQGYWGEGCQYMDCPGISNGVDCNGHGHCVSLRSIASYYDGFTWTKEHSYSNWDADRIFGCNCYAGWEGYDCSLRSCPKGDDPYYTAKGSRVPEQQTISCTCPGTCGGHMTLQFAGRSTAQVAHNAVATISGETATSTAVGTGAGESLEAKLQALFPENMLSGISVSPAGAICSNAGSTTTVTFSDGMGDAPLLRASWESTLTSGGTSYNDGATTIAVAVATTVAATTVRETCGNRGKCDTSEGTCTCDSGFSSSDGNGNSGDHGDCGKWGGTDLTRCPSTSSTVDCSGHGTCSGSNPYRCTCHHGYTGHNCAERTCPTGTAWFDEASQTDVAHASAECSNRGICDRTTGACSCNAGFTGGACQRTACPTGQNGKACSNRGRCASLREMAEVASVSGEPANAGQYEVQTMTCSKASGTFTVTFRHASTAAIAYSASATTFRAALEAIPTINFVDASISTGAQVCNTGGIATAITFTKNYGDLPLLASSDGSVSFAETVAGSRISYGESLSLQATWDADKMYGCMCDSYPDYNLTLSTGDLGKWFGYACEYRNCPHGTDPYKGIPIKYDVSCSHTSGSVTLAFGGETSPAIPYDATEATVKNSLLTISTVESALVAFETGKTTLCASGGVASSIYINTPTHENQVSHLAVVTTTLAGGAWALAQDATLTHQGNENQTMTCSATGGSFTLTFRQKETAAIAFDATAVELQTALQALDTVGFVQVVISSGSAVCAASSPTSTITFISQLGDLPLISADASSLTGGSLSIVETDKGNTELLECSNRGICNHKTGTCHCLSGYISGNGYGYFGARGDCGAVEHEYKTIGVTEAILRDMKRVQFDKVVHN